MMKTNKMKLVQPQALELVGQPRLLPPVTTRIVNSNLSNKLKMASPAVAASAIANPTAYSE